MRGDGLYTVLHKNLAAAMGVTEKHVSQMFKQQAGSWAMFDKAADALGYEWSVTLTPKNPCPSCLGDSEGCAVCGGTGKAKA